MRVWCVLLVVFCLLQDIYSTLPDGYLETILWKLEYREYPVCNVSTKFDEQTKQWGQPVKIYEMDAASTWEYQKCSEICKFFQFPDGGYCYQYRCQCVNKRGDDYARAWKKSRGHGGIKFALAETTTTTTTTETNPLQG